MAETEIYVRRDRARLGTALLTYLAAGLKKRDRRTSEKKKKNAAYAGTYLLYTHT